MKRSLSAVLAGSILLLSAGAAAAQAPAPAVQTSEVGDYGKFYWKKWDPMTLDRSQVAVQAQNANQLQTGLKAAGLNAAGVQAHAVDGWWLVPTPAGTTPEQLVALLAAQPTIDFAAPVFFSLPLGRDQ